MSVPVHYQLHLDPDLATGTLTGDEPSHVRVLSPTDQIILIGGPEAVARWLLLWAGR